MAGKAALLESVYEDLRRIAAAHLRRERNGHTLQTTALVHEAYLRIASRSDGVWSDRAAFCAAAIQAIRRVLVDHARARNRGKRGGGKQNRLTISTGDLMSSPAEWEYGDLDAALTDLNQIEPRVARVVELKFLCGLNDGEVAAQLACTRRTVQRDWRFARSWLSRRLAAYASPVEVDGQRSSSSE